MKYYDCNLLNPIVNGIEFIIDGKINKEIGLNSESFVAGENIEILKEADGKIKISATAGSSGQPTGYLSFTTDIIGILSYSISCSGVGYINAYYSNSSRPEKISVKEEETTINKTITTSSLKKNVLQDDDVKIISFKCVAQSLHSIDVSNNVNMEYLYVSNNNIKNIDVSNLSNLKAIDVSNNMITNIDISKNTSLEDINVSNNEISEITLNSGPSIVKKICINDTNISDFDFSKYINIEYVDMSNTGVSDFSSSSASLSYLNVENCPISNINITSGKLGSDGVERVLYSIYKMAKSGLVRPGAVNITGQERYVINYLTYTCKNRLIELGWSVTLDDYEVFLHRDVSTPTNMNSMSDDRWVITQSGAIDSGEDAWKAFNGLITRDEDSCGWHSNNSIPAWVQWEAIGEDNTVLIKDFYIIVDQLDGYTLWYPIDFAVQGSNNGVDWNTIITVTNQSDWQSSSNRGKWRRFTAEDNETPYVYHRIYISRSNGPYASILEMKAFPQLLEKPL